VAKVTGRAKYTDDFFIPGMLVAKYLRSTIAHGRVTKIDTGKAQQLPGVEAIFTYEDVPQNKFATAGHPYSLDPAHKDVEDRLLLTRDIRYWGDEIAVVVAENTIVLQEALKLIEVAYEEYDPLVTSEAALAEDAREIHAGSENVIGESHYAVGGDIEDVLTEADVVIEGRYQTQTCQHCHIENHIAYAYMDDLEHIVVVSSTQIPHIARRIVGEALDLPWGRIRVIKPYIGGGFGNKQDVILEPMVAFLTLKLGGRPVKIDLAREEGMIGTRVRHAFNVEMRAGVNRDGTLMALDIDAVSNTGAYASHGHSVAGAAGAKSRSLYPRSAIKFHARTVYTNTPAAGAMRAYGAPQMIFAVDCMIEEAARKIGMDPVAFRIKTGRRINPARCGVDLALPALAMLRERIRYVWRLPVPASFLIRMDPFIFRWVPPKSDRAWIPSSPKWRRKPSGFHMHMFMWCPPRIRTLRHLIQAPMPHARPMWPATPCFGRPGS
jgi:xanthine dehydrogenase molybdenum-binding subunit